MGNSANRPTCQLNLNYHVNSLLKIKLAESPSEIKEALRLVHDTYVKKGFMKPNDSGMRLTPFHFTKDTFVINAYWENQIVGTLSVIIDGDKGVPMAKIFDLSSFRQKKLRFAEISALAIDPSFRRKNGYDVLWPILRYMKKFITEYLALDLMVCCVNPSAVNFYDNIMGYSPLGEQKVSNYDFVEGAPAVGYFLEMSDYLNKYKQIYQRAPRKENLATYFSESKKEYENFPDNLETLINTSLIYLWEQRFLENRLVVKMSSNIFSLSNKVGDPFLIENISERGLQIKTDRSSSLTRDDKLKLKIKIKDQECAHLEYQKIWSNINGNVGYRCLKATGNWSKLWLKASKNQAFLAKAN